MKGGGTPKQDCDAKIELSCWTAARKPLLHGQGHVLSVFKMEGNCQGGLFLSLVGVQLHNLYPSSIYQGMLGNLLRTTDRFKCKGENINADDDDFSFTFLIAIQG